MGREVASEFMYGFVDGPGLLAHIDGDAVVLGVDADADADATVAAGLVVLTSLFSI